MSENKDSQTQDVENVVMQALAFARETGKDEIDAIDRLHKRTLVSLSVLTGLLTIMLSFLGWIGFTNLKRIAIATATDVVRQRLDDSLTREKIDSAVKDELQRHAEVQITESVRNQIDQTVEREVQRQTPELNRKMSVLTQRSIQSLQPRIELFARQQAEQLVKEINTPRTLSREQIASLSSCAKTYGPLTIPINVGGDPEAQNYAAALNAALAKGGWNTRGTSLLGGHLEIPRYGVIVAVRSHAHDDIATKAAMTCLKGASLDPAQTEVPDDEEWGTPPTAIIIQPKAK